MHKLTSRHSLPPSPSGFTLIELAIGMALVGIVLSGALLVSGKFWDVERRDKDREFLLETKAALLDFARKNGRFPMMDTSLNYAVNGDGFENIINYTPTALYPNFFGWVPYKNIDTKGRDALGKPVQYFVNWQLASEGGDRPCQALNKFFEGKITGSSNIYGYRYQVKWDGGPPPEPTALCWYPQLRFNGNGAYQIPVAAVLVGFGQNNMFDSLNATASNVTSTYFDKSASIDDVVVYVTLSEAYEALNCQ